MIKLKRCKRKSKEKLKKSKTRLDLDCMFPDNSARKRGLLTVNSCIKVCLDLQADKSPIVVKGPSSGEPNVSNPWNNVQRKDSI
jgi:hypothetical protein